MSHKNALGLSFKEMSVVFFADLLTSKVNIQWSKAIKVNRVLFI